MNEKLNRTASLNENQQPSLDAEFDVGRRTFLQVMGAGLLVTVAAPQALAQPGRGQESAALVARIYLADDGSITALSGKVEEGQGARAELTQAVAEEFRVPVDSVKLVMADTDLVPDDGITAGSRTTPRNVPEMRQAAATARELLTRIAADHWQVGVDQLEISAAGIAERTSGKRLTFVELGRLNEVTQKFSEGVRPDVALAAMKDWTVLGTSVPRPNSRDLVTGAHQFPTDVQRPGMLYGRVLRPPAYGAELKSVDLSPAEGMEGVRVVREGDFIGFAAPSAKLASGALDAVSKSAQWSVPSNPVTDQSLYAHLKAEAREAEARGDETGSLAPALDSADRNLEATYHVAFIQHAPMEPRAAVAEWSGDRLTTWAGCDGPFRAQNSLSEALGVPKEQVRVIVPDIGGGFGGKHTAEAAIEAARLAKATGRPVSVRWTREEEFTWAYFRPAAVIECKGGLDRSGGLVAWDFANINAGSSAIDTPYKVPNTRIRSIGSSPPLRQGSYRCLAATGNNFARESFMDELALAAKADPLDFRLAHLGSDRLRRVLEKAASSFGWARRRLQKTANRGIGLACGTEKNSVVAACVEVEVDPKKGTIKVLEVCEAFECGPVLNPTNLVSQIQGCIVMGLGGALSEEILFKDGAITNPRFSRYKVPRFRDVPRIDVHLVPNPDIPAAGGGETPIIAVAPAIGNAVFAATGVRLRSMPMRFPAEGS